MASRKTPVKKRSSVASKTPHARPKTAAKKPYPDNTADNTKPPRASPADAVDLLSADHLAAGKIFKQHERLAKKDALPSQRKELADKVCAMLTVHTKIEEEIFYPAAREAGLDVDMMDEALIEHATAKELIAQIQAGKPGDEFFDAKVKVLSDYIEHHVIEEHTEMFPKCRRSRMDLVALRAKMSARKKELELKA
ncbi:MAG: hemerythrin domain-containing protein [Caldimonas sp.]